MPRTLRPSPRALAWLLALVACCLVASPASATAVKELSDAELVANAKLIGRVECVATSTEWCAAGKRILTRVRFVVREVYKGDAQLRDLEILLPGGERDGLSYAVHGIPQFREGEEAVIFLTGQHPKSKICLPVGLGQGLYRVHRRAGKPAEAVRDTRGLLLVGEGKQKPRPGKLERVDLDELLAEVRAEVAKQRAARGAESPR